MPKGSKRPPTRVKREGKKSIKKTAHVQSMSSFVGIMGLRKGSATGAHSAVKAAKDVKEMAEIVGEGGTAQRARRIVAKAKLAKQSRQLKKKTPTW